VTRPERGREQAEVERIRAVYALRDARPGRHPAIAAAYRRLNAERTRITHDLIATVAPPPSGRLVDIGCGAGYDLAGWLRHGWQADHIAGVDVVPERVERARAACPGVDVRLSDGMRLPFADGVFDIATAVTVFSSILDPEMGGALFQEMERLVRPSGLIVVYDFVVRKPTNANVRGMSIDRLAALGRPPAGSVRLSPLLPLVAVGEMIHPRLAELAMRFAPRTHRLSWWTAGDGPPR
jgi:ubiquinone/menaquinone biosynthesis C-methylase UbiE